MAFPRVVSAEEAANLIQDDAVVTVSSSSGLGCPDAVLAAIGERFEKTAAPRNLTTLHPIAAGDMYGIKGIDHIARKGLLKRILAGSYPSGPSSMPSPGDLADDRQQRGRSLQHPQRHPVRHAPRGGGQAARRPDQGRSRHLRRSEPRGVRHERRRRGAASRAQGRVRRRGVAVFPCHNTTSRDYPGDHGG